MSLDTLHTCVVCPAPAGERGASARGRVRVRALRHFPRFVLTTGMTRGRLVLALVVALITAGTRDAATAGTVGTGTAGSCTEAGFVTGVAGGGAVTFDCGSSTVTITLTSM